MSRAFVKEDGDEQWLHDVAPTINALIAYLTKENNGVRVYEQRTTTRPDGMEVHHMSNGMAYGKDNDGKWELV